MTISNKTGMLSTRLAASLQRRDIHYGWVVIAATFLTMLATAGALGSAGDDRTAAA